MQHPVMRIGLVALLVALPALGWAADSKLSRGDEKFLKEAVQHNMAEVQLGKLAQERGASEAVKKFGERMEKDHGTALEEVKQLAQQKAVALPADLDRGHKKTYDRLAKLSGVEFDRAFMKEMVRDHDKDVKEFQKAAEKLKDPDVKAWAAKTLPTLVEHQQQAKQLRASVQGGSPAASPRQK